MIFGHSLTQPTCAPDSLPKGRNGGQPTPTHPSPLDDPDNARTVATYLPDTAYGHCAGMAAPVVPPACAVLSQGPHCAGHSHP